MKKILSYLTISMIISVIIFIPVIIIFNKPLRIYELSTIGLIIIISVLLFSYFLIDKKKIRFYQMTVVLYLAGIFFTGLILFNTNKNTNLPPLERYFVPKHTEVIYNNFHREDLFSYYKNRSSKSLVNYFFRTSSEPSIRISEADSLVHSFYSFVNYPSIRISDNHEWSENPYNDPSWNFELHKMKYIFLLTEAYKKYKDLKYLIRAEYLILDWISDNSSYLKYPPSPKNSWGDHTTALRLTNWLYFWETWVKSPLLTREKMEKFISSVIAHSERLNKPEFYTENHNHGIAQDIALISAALMFPEINVASNWRNLALKRLKKQISFSVSENGIHLEHSPGYHFYGLGQLQNINNLLKEWELEKHFDLNLDQIINKMVQFTKFLVQPDGKIVPVGDTNVEYINKYKDWLNASFELDQELLYLTNQGKLGQINNTSVSFPREGYAIIRDFDNGMLPFENSFYLFFTASANIKRGHKHLDDLSFTLSYGGSDLLIDPGFYSYKKDSLRSYVLSTRAHNSVTVDNKNFNNNDLLSEISMLSTPENWQTELEKFSTDSNLTIIQASHQNYKDLKHTRRLIYFRPNIILLLDNISPGSSSENLKTHSFDQLFHAGKDINIEIITSGKEVRFVKSQTREPLMRIMQLEDGIESSNIVRGAKSPVQGWITINRGELIPGDVVAFTQKGTSADFVTILELKEAMATKYKDTPWAEIDYDKHNNTIRIKKKNNNLNININSL